MIKGHQPPELLNGCGLSSGRRQVRDVHIVQDLLAQKGKNEALRRFKWEEHVTASSAKHDPVSSMDYLL